MPASKPSNVSGPCNLRTIQRGLRQVVFSPSNVKVFESAQARRPALREFAGIESVLGTLADRTRCPASRADRIVSALINEYQREHHAFWSSVLTLTFMPMLGNILRQIDEPILAYEDLSQTLILAFHEVLAELDLSESQRLTILRLRQETRRRVFSAIKEERRIRGLYRTFDDNGLINLSNEDCEWPDSPIPPSIEDPVIIETAVEMLRGVATRFISDDDIELIACTAIRGESLWKYVDRKFSGSSDPARIRAHARLKRRRTRKIVEIRYLFAKLFVPKTDVSAS
ncbi:MAG TPA: hypothetical protein PKH54_07380 [Myxococcota bacterium]|nr:hypothetical protein [Myxococcota bacterium]